MRNTFAAALFIVTCLSIGADAEAVDCKMGKWTPWTKCTQACDCGIQQRTREVLVDAKNGGKECPWDSEASTCNCAQCTSEQKAKDLLPAATAHGFVSKKLTPKGGFPTDYGEQAACILDKAEAVLDLLPAMFVCDSWDEDVGETCYPESIDHLVRHTQMCCEGREHFVLWKSDVMCEKKVASFNYLLRTRVKPLFDKCVNKGKKFTKKECSDLPTRTTWNTWATIIRNAFSAANDLYAQGDPKDKTPAAKAMLKLCLPEMTDDKNAYEWLKLKKFLVRGDKPGEAPQSAQKCLDMVSDYMNNFGNLRVDVDGAHLEAVPKQDTRRRV